MMTVPPATQHDRAFQWAAPCMSGGAGRARTVPLASATSSSNEPYSEPSRRRTPSAATRKSSWRHIAPLGMPVVPPV